VTGSDFYLLCFLVGFSLSVLSFLAGAVNIHLPFHMHLPFHGAHHAGGVSAGGHTHGGGLKSASMKSGGHMSWLNASTILAFLAWFGGVGYILTKHSHFMAVATLSFALMAEGTVGTVSMSIRENGTGEVIFEQDGGRKSTGARSEDGTSLPKGTEVVIARYDDGIAYVKRWDEYTK
jgi:hypothetical protein